MEFRSPYDTLHELIDAQSKVIQQKNIIIDEAADLFERLVTMIELGEEISFRIVTAKCLDEARVFAKKYGG